MELARVDAPTPAAAQLLRLAFAHWRYAARQLAIAAWNRCTRDGYWTDEHSNPD
jgi:hypothetical protein